MFEDSSLFSSESAHQQTMYWWMGQVVDEKNWQDNSNKKIHDRKDVAGWGKRYKIRIFGREEQVKVVDDDRLEMAEVMYPVTAGSGHGGSYQTPNIRQGSYVVGFYKDGKNGTEPCIMGCLGNASQTDLFLGDPPVGFIPRDGWIGKSEKKKVSKKDLYQSGGGLPNNNSKQEQNLNNKDLHIQVADGLIVDVVLKTIECDGPGGEMKGIQGAIQKLLATIARIKLAYGAAMGAAQEAVSNINSIVNSTVAFVTGLVKKLIDKMRGYAVNKLNTGLKDVATLVFPNERWSLSKAFDKANDTLECVFKKVIEGLLKLVQGLISKIIDKVIGGAACAAENFIGGLVSNVMGPISNGVQDVLNTINGVLNTIQGIAGKAFSIIDFVTGFLKFLLCEDTPSCEYKDKWSIWNGSKTAKAVQGALDKTMNDIDSGLDKALGIKSGSAAGGGGGSGCGNGPALCGPPSISITGGNGGSGAAANAVIGAAGEIMGLDFSSFGSGYRSTPAIEIDDNCNSGGGAQISLITNNGGGNTTSYQQSGTVPEDPDVNIVGAVVDPNNAGVGYLPAPNGSAGGDGYPIARPDETILIKNPELPDKPLEDVLSNTDPSWEVLKPGDVGRVDPDDILYLPIGTTVEIYDDTGEVVEVIDGFGLDTSSTVQVGGTFTAPASETPQVQQPSYTVIAILDDVIINDPGQGYTDGDTIFLTDGEGDPFDTPNNGVEIKPIFNSDGQLKKLEIISKGKSFNTMPLIDINSQTGFNADIWPVFRFETVENVEELLNEGQSILTVIDCVGKYRIPQ